MPKSNTQKISIEDLEGIKKACKNAGLTCPITEDVIKGEVAILGRDVYLTYNAANTYYNSESLEKAIKGGAGPIGGLYRDTTRKPQLRTQEYRQKVLGEVRRYYYHLNKKKGEILDPIKLDALAHNYMRQNAWIENNPVEKIIETKTEDAWRNQKDCEAFFRERAISALLAQALSERIQFLMKGGEFQSDPAYSERLYNISSLPNEEVMHSYYTHNNAAKLSPLEKIAQEFFTDTVNLIQQQKTTIAFLQTDASAVEKEERKNNFQQVVNDYKQKHAPVLSNPPREYRPSPILTTVGAMLWPLGILLLIGFFTGPVGLIVTGLIGTMFSAIIANIMYSGRDKLFPVKTTKETCAGKLADDLGNAVRNYRAPPQAIILTPTPLSAAVPG